MRTLFFMMLASAGLVLPAIAAEPTEAERAVWQLEEAYRRYVQAGDVDSYVTLWHEDFVGWPCFSRTPSDKGGIGNWVRDIRDNRWKLTYTLRPLAARTFGDVVARALCGRIRLRLRRRDDERRRPLAQVHAHLEVDKRRLADHHGNVRRPGTGRRPALMTAPRRAARRTAC